MSLGTITAQVNENYYKVKIPGIDTELDLWCCTADVLTVGSKVAIADVENTPPSDKSKVLPNTGVYVYSDDRSWMSPEQLMDAKHTLAIAFLFFDRWRDECPEYLADQISSIIDSKWVELRDRGLARVDYMDCDAAVFAPNDFVLVKFDRANLNRPVVVGFLDNPRRCSGDWLMITSDQGIPGFEFAIVWNVREDQLQPLSVAGGELAQPALKSDILAAFPNISWIEINKNQNVWSGDPTCYESLPGVCKLVNSLTAPCRESEAGRTPTGSGSPASTPSHCANGLTSFYNSSTYAASGSCNITLPGSPGDLISCSLECSDSRVRNSYYVPPSGSVWNRDISITQGARAIVKNICQFTLPNLPADYRYSWVEWLIEMDANSDREEEVTGVCISGGAVWFDSSETHDYTGKKRTWDAIKTEIFTYGGLYRNLSIIGRLFPSEVLAVDDDYIDTRDDGARNVIGYPWMGNGINYYSALQVNENFDQGIAYIIGWKEFDDILYRVVRTGPGDYTNPTITEYVHHEGTELDIWVQLDRPVSGDTFDYSWGAFSQVGAGISGISAYFNPDIAQTMKVYYPS